MDISDSGSATSSVYTKVSQSLEREDSADMEQVHTIRRRSGRTNVKDEFGDYEEDWWMVPFKSYYTQLAWGRFCSIVQPILGKTFSGSKILPNLWIANHESTCDLQSLKDRNIKHIICAVLGLTARFPNDFHYYMLRIRDTNEDIYQYFDYIADLIQKCLSKNEPVLVHCRHGVSRSVTLVAAYLIKFCNMTVKEAIEFIQQSRQCANPIPPFRHQLASFEENCRSDKARLRSLQ